MDYRNLIDGYQSLEDFFQRPAYHVGVVHGKMKSEEKDDAISHFARGETVDIGVHHRDQRVGVDIPNASVMVIESAERFGLAQLHQLRGRVGRGAEQSYCILMTGNKLSSESKKRMDAMVATTDGFKIAELDLKMRGYGDMMGLRQSGMSGLKLADLTRDVEVLEHARRAAQDLLFSDPELSLPQNVPVKAVYDGMMQGRALWSYIS